MRRSRSTAFAGPAALRRRSGDPGAPTRRNDSRSGRALTAGFLVAVAGVVAIAAASPGSAPAGLRLIKERASHGRIQAELRYYKRTGPGAFGYQDARIVIRRDGVTRVDRPVRIGGCSSCEAWPLRPRHALHLRNLDGSSEYEVLVRLYTGGAHCCGYDRIYKYSAALGRYIVRSHNWGDAFARIRDLGGGPRPEFRSADNRFFYRFAAFAFSAAPVQIWRFQGARFVDVTRRHSFRPVIRRDKRHLWRSYLRARANPDRELVRGVLPAWLADKYLLGHGGKGWSTLRRIARRGDLGAHPDKYLGRVRRFLRRTGYIQR